MIKKFRNLSIYSISNFISVIGPLAIVTILVNLLSKESYAEMVSGQLAFFYSTIIVSFGLNTSGITLLKSDNLNIIGWTNLIKFKSILFSAIVLFSLIFSFFLELKLAVFIYIFCSCFEIFNLTPLVLYLEKPKYIFKQKITFTILYFLLVYSIVPHFPHALSVSVLFFFSLLLSYLITYTLLLKKYKFKLDSKLNNKTVFKDSYKYFLSQIGGQIYATLPRFLSLGVADFNFVKIVDVLEKIVMLVRILIGSITTWYGSMFLKINSYKSLIEGLSIVLLICILLIFPGFKVLEFYITNIIGINDIDLLNITFIISILLFVTSVNIFLCGYIFLNEKKEIFALVFLMISCLIVFFDFEISNRFESIYLLMIKTEILVLFLSISFFGYLKLKK